MYQSVVYSTTAEAPRSILYSNLATCTEEHFYTHLLAISMLLSHRDRNYVLTLVYALLSNADNISKRRRSANQNDSISIRVLKRLAASIPVRVKARHGTKSSLLHPRHCLLEVVPLGEIEYKQVVLCRRTASSVPVLGRKLKMVSCTLVAKHDAVKVLVLVEAEEQLEA